MGRSVSDAAAQAVAKSNKKESTARTLEQVIADIRKNASAGLSVTSADILSLLGVYDITVAQAFELVTRIAQLTEQNERFREVYELENHSSSVKIEKVDEFENVKVETLVGTNVSGGHTDEFIAGVAGALNASTSGE